MDQAENLRRLIRNKPSSKSNSCSKQGINIYTIASGKGGVGKTNFVVNLAICLQKKGKQVLVIDADLGMANVDVVLGIRPQYTLYDVLFNHVKLEEALIIGPEGIQILPGGSGIIEMASLDVCKQEALAEEFTTLNNIDIILIDTGAGISKNLLSFISFSQELILVTTPEPTALTDAYSVMKVLSHYQLKKKIKVVVNRSPDEGSARNSFLKLLNTSKSFLNIELENIGFILEDHRVVQSIMHQEPFCLRYPKGAASRCINSISDRFIGQKSNIRIRSIQQVYNRLIKVFG